MELQIHLVIGEFALFVGTGTAAGSAIAYQIQAMMGSAVVELPGSR